MVKMTLDQKIEKVKNSIQKENEIIAISTAKVKELNKELKLLSEDNNIRLFIYETTKIIADITPISATNKNVIWSSNKPHIADIDSNGVVTAYSPGVVIIQAKTVDGGLTAACMVTVS